MAGFYLGNIALYEMNTSPYFQCNPETEYCHRMMFWISVVASFLPVTVYGVVAGRWLSAWQQKMLAAFAERIRQVSDEALHLEHPQIGVRVHVEQRGRIVIHIRADESSSETDLIDTETKATDSLLTSIAERGSVV